MATLDEFVKDSIYYPHRAALVDYLWVNGSPTIKAYYRLKGTDIQYGVIQETAVKINDKYVYCSWLMWRLTLLRKDNPEEQILEMLR